MSNIVGKVIKVEGVVKAINPETGEARVLQEGSQVFAGEILQTSGRGGVVVEMNNGTLLTLGRDTQMRLDDDVVSEANYLDSGTEGAVDVAALQQAILDGNFDELEATAAGDALIVGSSSDGGVFVERVAAQGEVTAGFVTTTNEPNFEPIARDTLFVPTTNEAAPNTIPTILVGASRSVSEVGLRSTSDNSELVQGDISLNSQDGIQSVTIGGQVISNAELLDLASQPISITTSKGVLTLENFDPATGQLDYVYQITDAQAHTDEPLVDDIDIVLTENDGDTTEATLQMLIEDDAPVANPDVNQIDEDTPAVSGNVLTNDQLSADDTEVVSTGIIQGQFGVLTLFADGSYDYELDNTLLAVQQLEPGEKLEENFSYTIEDADGDQSSAQLVIDINGQTDEIPQASIDDVSVNEDAGSMTFTVSLSNTYYAPVTLDYQTVDGTSTAGLDYDAVAGQLEFQPGETTQTITVPVNDDFIYEGSETLDVVLSNPTNAVIVDDTGLGIISDETTFGPEDTINLSLTGDASVTEGGTASYTVTASETALTPLDVDIIIGHKTTSDGDITPISKTVTIPAGSDSVSFTVDNFDDVYADDGEVYNVALSGLVSGGGFENYDVDTTPLDTTILDNTNPGTETDDEVVNVTLTGDEQVQEGATASYTITLDEPAATEMQVTVQTGHIETEDGDFITSTFVVTIPAGDSSASFTVSNNPDDLAEGNEEFNVALTGDVSGGGFETVNVNSTPVVTDIIDDDVLSISVNNVTVNEDDGVLEFTVALSKPTTSAVSFDYATEDNGSAIVGDDYSAVSGSETIAAGLTSINVSVPITDDYIAENPETFVINLSNVSAGVVVEDAQGVGTILDEDEPGNEDTVTVNIAGDAAVNEGEAASYTVSTDKPVVDDLTVDVSYVYVSAESGDVVTNTTQVTIPAGSSSAPVFLVDAVDDAYLEGNEVFEVSISNPQGGGVEKLELGTTSAQTTILDGNDNETPPTDADKAFVSIKGDAEVVEGNSANYVVSVDKTPTEDLTIDVTYTYLSAETGDIVEATTPVTILAGTNSTDFDVATVDDVYAEGDEVYRVEIENPSLGGFENVEVLDGAVDTTIKDNTLPGTEADEDVVEVKLGSTGNVVEGAVETYTITLDEPAASAMTVDVQISHVDTDSGDVVSEVKTIDIPAGADSVTFDVATLQDNLTEGNEDYQVALTGSFTGGGFETVSVDTAPVTTTIIDDEGLPSLVVDDVTVDEDAGTLVFTVSMNNPTTEPVTFSYSTADNGSALAGQDYTAISGSATIPVNQTQTTISVPITDDYIAENDETFLINLSDVSANAVIADDQGVGTITDEAIPATPEDAVTLTLSQSQTEIVESTSGTYTVSADKPVVEDLTVTIKTAHIDTESGDYVEQDTTVTILAGTQSTDFTIDSIDDAYAEGSEEFSVTMSDPVGGGVEKIELDNTQVITAIVDETSPASEDTATVSISGTSSVIEGDTATYTITVDKVPTEPLVISLETQDVTTEADDYEALSSGTITIPAGQQSIIFTLDAFIDTTYETTENYKVVLTDVNGGGFENTVIGVSTVDTQIADANTAKPVVSINAIDPSAEEGVDNEIQFKVQQNRPSNEDTDVIVSLDLNEAEAADITAINYDDANGVTQTISTADLTNGLALTIPATPDGTAPWSPVFTFTVADDAIYEVSETFNMNVELASGETDATVGNATDSATIVDEDNPLDPPSNDGDKPALSIEASPSTGVEGESNVVFTISQDNVSEFTTKVNFTLDLATAGELENEDIAEIILVDGDGTTISITDPTDIANFITDGTAFTIDANSTQTPTVTVVPEDDTVYEISEAFEADLSNPVNATIATGTAAAEIVDEDDNDPTTPPTDDGDKPSISVSSTSAEEGDDEIFTVSLSNESKQDVSFDLTTAIGSASATDYEGTSLEVSTDGGTTWTPASSATISAGNTSVLVKVPTVEDTINESAEDFTLIATVTAGDTSNVSSTGTAIILDDDVPTITTTPPTTGTDPSAPDAADANVVHEQGLRSASDADESNTTSNTFSVNSTDAITSLTVGGEQLVGVDYAGGASVSVVTPNGEMEITNYDASTGEVTYSYTVDTAQTHADADGNNLITDAIAIVATDSDGDIANGTVSIEIVDDVPEARMDQQTLSEDDVGIAGNVITGINATTDTLGADGATVTGVQAGNVGSVEITTGVSSGLVGTYGTLTISTDGTYDYVLDASAQSLGNGEIGTDIFSYTLKDADGDFATTTVTFDVTGTNDGPICGPGSARLSEELLVGGIEDNIGSNDLDAQNVYSGTLLISDVDVNDDLTVTLSEPASTLTSNGVDVEWTGDGSSGSPLVGSANGNEVIRAIIDESGNYTVTLSGPVDHTEGDNIEGELSFDIGVEVSDGLASASNTLTVTIEDDSPETVDSVASLEVVSDVLQVQNYQAGWVNPVFINGTDTVNLIDNDADTLTDEMRWGSPASGSGKSGYNLDDNTSLSTPTGSYVNTGEPINFGTFTHNNFPIFGNSSTLDSVTLSIQLDVVINGVVTTVDLTVPVDHTETPNVDGDPEVSRDIITLPTNSQTVTIAGQDYVVSLEGFQDNEGNLVSTIFTDENAANTFTIFGQITTSDTLPVVSGTVSGEPGADGLDSIVWGDTSSSYGTLTTNPDGSYSFEVNRETKDALLPGESLAQEFTYSVIDNDGDVSTSTLTIELNGASAVPVGIDEVQIISSQSTTNIATGNVMDNIDFGLDGAGQIDSIAYNGLTYTTAAFPSGVTISLENGGNVFFDFATGDYTFNNSAGSITSNEEFIITASDADGDSTTFDLRLSAAGTENIPAINYSEDLTSSVSGWAGPVNASAQGMLIQGNESTTKLFDFGAESAGREVTVNFSLTVENGWEDETENNTDFFNVLVNGVSTFSDSYSDGTDIPYSFPVTLDENGQFSLTLATDTSVDSEDAWINDFNITSPAFNNVVEDILYGDNNEIEQFIINSDEDITIVDFDSNKDFLDISEVINNDESVTETTLAQYLDFALVDTDTDGEVDSARIDIDSNGNADAGGTVTSVIIDNQLLDENDIDDLNIDFQND